MGEMKPTPGPWLAVPYSAKRFGLGTAGEGAWMYLQTIYQDADHPEMRANARLIAEAGTVFHNTSLSPVQLVEMVENLKELAADFMDAQADLDNREYMGIHAKPYEVLIRRRNLARDDLDAALAKCEGVGND